MKLMVTCAKQLGACYMVYYCRDAVKECEESCVGALMIYLLEDDDLMISASAIRVSGHSL